MFLAALTRASRFLPFKLSSFLFLSLKLPSWFLQFIEVIVRTSGDRKSPDRRLKFSYLFTRTYLYTFIIYLHLSLSSLYAYISIFISFFMSQRICTHCAHNRFINDFFDSNSTRVLNLCLFCRVSSAFICIQLYWLFYKLIQFKRRSLQELNSNVFANSLRWFKRAHFHVTFIQSSSSFSLLIFINSLNSIQSLSSSLSIFINSLDFIQFSRQSTSASRSINISCNAYQELIVNYWNNEHTLELFMKHCSNCTALHWKFKFVLNLYLYIICCFKDDELLNSLSDSSSLIKSFFKNDTAQSKHFLNHIQDYNHALIFTSCMYTANKHFMNQREIQAFIVHDELYHLQRSLYSTVQELSCFAQLYFHDSAQMITMRLTQSLTLHESLLRQLNKMIWACDNLFIDMYKSAQEQLETAWQSTNFMHVILNSQLKLIVERDFDQRHTTLLTINEVAVFISDEYNEIEYQDIVLAKCTAVDKESRFHYVNHDNVAYFSLHYVLFFSEDKSSWHWALQLHNDDHSCIKTHYSRCA